MNRTVVRFAPALVVVASLGACADQTPPPQSGYNAGYGAPGYGAPGYGAPGYGAPGYGAPGYGPAPTATAPGGYPPAPTATAPGGYAPAPTAPGGYAPAPTATAPGGYPPAPTATAPAPQPTAPAPTSAPPAGTTPPPAGTAPGGFPWPFPFPAPGGTSPAPAPAPGGQAPAGGSAQPIDPSMAQVAIGPLMIYANQEAPGMTREGNPAAAQFKEGQTLEAPFQMLPGKCYAVLAVGAGVQEVDIQIQTVVLNVSQVVAQDQGAGDHASVGGRGNCYKWLAPIGVNAKYVLKATRGNGIIAGQLYVK